MVTEEKMYEEIDKATSSLLICNLLDEYANLLRLKFSVKRDLEIEEYLSILEMKMMYLGINYLDVKAHYDEKK